MSEKGSFICLAPCVLRRVADDGSSFLPDVEEALGRCDEEGMALLSCGPLD